MSSSSGYNNAGEAFQSISCKLRATDLPSKRLLGKGLASVVYETEWKGLRCARKDFMGVPSEIFEAEASALVHLEHDNIVKTHGWTVDKMSCSLVVEYVEDDLSGLLQHRKKSQGTLAGTGLELQEGIEVMLQIAKAMAYLHEQGIIHGDLKTSNIFVTQVKDSSKNSSLVKVADFGLVQTKRKSIPFVSRPVRKLDMVQWKGPEYFEKSLSHVSENDEESSESDSSSNEVCISGSFDASNDGPQFQACDMYSFALTCYQILTGKKPYPSWNWKALGAKIVQDNLRPKLPTYCPVLLAILLGQCWNQDRMERPTFTNICKTLEEIQLTILQSIDHLHPIMRFLDGSSSDAIATQKIAIASSSKNINIEIKNEPQVELNTSSESLLKIPHLKTLHSSGGLSNLMGDPFGTHVAINFAIDALLKEVMKNAISAYVYKDLCNELVDKLEMIQPIVTKLEQRASVSKHAECIKWLKHFKGILLRVEPLIKDCSQESRLVKTKRTLKFWKWNKLSTLLTKINYEIDEARANALMLMLDVQLTNVGESLGFAKQAIPSVIVGVEEHFNKLKTSILQSHGRGDEPSTFGLQGSGGTGKTLLAQMLNNDIDVKETYGDDSIIWITVGIDASVGDLYERMGKCSILDSNDSQRLKLLHNMEDQRMFLKEAFSKKKILLILDDVWEKQYDHHDMMYWLDVAKAPGSTMLITTRSESVLQRARAEVSVVLSLNDDDSWKLFSSHAFVDVATSLKTIPEELPRAICKECKGLPLALKVIGSAMMDKMSIEEWEMALLDLQQSSPIFDSNVDDELFSRLQSSYEELKSDTTRICFLYFAAFPEDHKIGVVDLINIWVGEELFGSNLNTTEATVRAYDHLRTLAKQSLIDWNDEEGYARIHDILRDLALYIIDNAKVGECAYECLFYSEKTSISFPTSERVVGLKRISFMNCNVYKWPEDFEIACPEVKVCIIRNTTIMDIGAPLGFFKNMFNVRILDVSRNSNVPKDQLMSITNFAYLRKLNLSYCDSLHKLPKSIGNLERLTKLDLRSCGSLMGLPKSIGNLKYLTVLDLSTCGSLTGLPDSIGNLEHLTKLHLRECGSLMGLPESIGNLKCLTVLDLSACGSLTGLPESIGNLKCLRVLDLSACGSLIGLPGNIGNLKCLTILDLSTCGSLTGLLKSINNLEHLTTILELILERAS